MIHSYLKFTDHLEQINAYAKARPESFIRRVEESFQESVREVADAVEASGGACKVIMLSGPSASGKTTTARKVMEELEKRGFGAVTISLDDFYLGEGKAPRLPSGEHDYESVHALDVPEIERCLLSLMLNGACDMPVFDFPARRPSPERRHVELGERDIAVVEGIHALNPLITEHLPEQGMLKLYISVKQGLKDADGEVLSHQDIRLIRRVVRDYQYRGALPEESLAMWDAVCAGERRYIQPFKRTSDQTINSIHIYEPCVFRAIATPLFAMIPAESPHAPLAQRLISALQRFEPIENALVPANSLLREFLGGGIY